MLEWQSTGSAPKDGRAVLLHQSDGFGDRFVVARWDRAAGGWVRIDASSGGPFEAGAWVALAPPTATRPPRKRMPRDNALHLDGYPIRIERDGKGWLYTVFVRNRFVGDREMLASAKERAETIADEIDQFPLAAAEAVQPGPARRPAT
jgi:hypothetical protein